MSQITRKTYQCQSGISLITGIKLHNPWPFDTWVMRKICHCQNSSSWRWDTAVVSEFHALFCIRLAFVLGFSGTRTARAKRRTWIVTFMFLRRYYWECPISELYFYNWNANWSMKCEAKMAACGGRFRTSVLVSHVIFYTSSRDLVKNSHRNDRISLQKTGMSLRISIIFEEKSTALSQV